MDLKIYKIGNIDSLIMIEKPKMAPYISLMRENVAKVLDCDINQINIKATRGEGLGYIGRGEGVEAYSICLLIEK